MFKQAAHRVDSIVRKAPQYPGVSLLVNDNGSKEQRLRETKEASLKIKRLVKDKLEVLHDREQLVAKGIEVPRLFERLNVYYACSTACVQELSSMLASWDLKELGEATVAVFDSFRSMIDILMTQYSITHEKLTELEKRKLNTVSLQESYLKSNLNVTLQAAVFDKSEEPSTAYPAQTPGKMRSIDSFRAAGSPKFARPKGNLRTAFTSRANSMATFARPEPMTPSVSRPAQERYPIEQVGSPRVVATQQMFDFSSNEEIKAREEAELKQIQDKLRVIRNGMKEGKFVDLNSIKDPRLMVAINKELCSDMIQTNLEQRRQLNTILTNIDNVSANRAEAPAHLEKVLNEQKKVIAQLKLDEGESEHFANSAQILKNMSEAEIEFFSAFTEKQKELMNKVVRAIQHHKPGVNSKMVGTTMTSTHIEHLLTGKELSEAKKNIKNLELYIMKLQVEIKNQTKEYDQVYARARIAETLAKEKDSEMERMSMEKLKTNLEQTKSQAQLDVLKNKQTQESKTKDALEREVDQLRKMVRQFEIERNSITTQMKDLMDKFQIEHDQSAKDHQDSVISEKEESKLKSSKGSLNLKEVQSAPPKIQSVFFKVVSQFMGASKQNHKSKAGPSEHKQTQTVGLLNVQSSQNLTGAAKPNVSVLSSANNITFKSQDPLINNGPKYTSLLIPGPAQQTDEPDLEESRQNLMEELSQDSRHDSLATARSGEIHQVKMKKSIYSKPKVQIKKPEQKSTSTLAKTGLKNGTSIISSKLQKAPNEKSVPVDNQRGRRGSILDPPKQTQGAFKHTKRNSMSLEATKNKPALIKVPEVEKLPLVKPIIESDNSETDEQQEVENDQILTPTIRKMNQGEIQQMAEQTDEPTFFSGRTARNNREFMIPEAISEIPEIGSLDEQGHIMLAIATLKKLPSPMLVFDIASIVELYISKQKPFTSRIVFAEDTIQITDAELESKPYSLKPLQSSIAIQTDWTQPLVSNSKSVQELKLSISRDESTPNGRTNLLPISGQALSENKGELKLESSVQSARSRKPSTYLLPPAKDMTRRQSSSMQNLPLSRQGGRETERTPTSSFGAAASAAKLREKENIAIPQLTVFKPRAVGYFPPAALPSAPTAQEQEAQARARLLSVLTDKALFYSSRTLPGPISPRQLLAPGTDLSDQSPVLRGLFQHTHGEDCNGGLEKELSDMQHSRFFYVRRQFAAFASRVREFVSSHRGCGESCPHLARFYKQLDSRDTRLEKLLGKGMEMIPAPHR